MYRVKLFLMGGEELTWCLVYAECNGYLSQSAVPKLTLSLDKDISFVIFRRTHCSVYGTSAGNMYGLIVCTLPLGLLLCLSEPPAPMNSAVTTVENFCRLIRTWLYTCTGVLKHWIVCWSASHVQLCNHFLLTLTNYKSTLTTKWINFNQNVNTFHIEP